MRSLRQSIINALSLWMHAVVGAEGRVTPARTAQRNRGCGVPCRDGAISGMGMRSAGSRDAALLGVATLYVLLPAALLWLLVAVLRRATRRRRTD
jgi:hypothetical protein